MTDACSQQLICLLVACSTGDFGKLRCWLVSYCTLAFFSACPRARLQRPWGPQRAALYRYLPSKPRQPISAHNARARRNAAQQLPTDPEPKIAGLARRAGAKTPPPRRRTPTMDYDTPHSSPRPHLVDDSMRADSPYGGPRTTARRHISPSILIKWTRRRREEVEGVITSELRMKKDLAELAQAKMTSPHVQTTIDFPDGDVLHLRVTLRVAAGFYAGGTFVVSLKVPSNYPFRAPTATALLESGTRILMSRTGASGILCWSGTGSRFYRSTRWSLGCNCSS